MTRFKNLGCRIFLHSFLALGLGGTLSGPAAEAPGPDAEVLLVGEACQGLLSAGDGTAPLFQAFEAPVRKLLARERAPRKRDLNAPGRLLVSARFLYACGKVLHDDEAMLASFPRMMRAMALRRADGIFIGEGRADAESQERSAGLVRGLAAIGEPAVAVLLGSTDR